MMAVTGLIVRSLVPGLLLELVAACISTVPKGVRGRMTEMLAPIQNRGLRRMSNPPNLET